MEGDEQIRCQDKRVLRRQVPCGSRSYISALAGHRDGTRQRSDVIVVRSGEIGVQAASRS